VDINHNFNFLFYAAAYIGCGKQLTIPAGTVVYYQRK